MFVPEDKRKFVADPRIGSKHNRGCAVDLSIYDLKTGKTVPMPSDFDEFTERASPDYKGGTDDETPQSREAPTSYGGRRIYRQPE